MRFLLSKVAGTAALTVAATALTLPLAAPAQASTPQRVWTVWDSNGDLAHGLYYVDSDAGSLTPVKVEESELSDVYSLSSSADGSRIIYMRDTYLPATDDVKQEVVVRDVSTRLVRVLETRLVSGGTFPDQPSLSPDGTRAVWEVSDANDILSVRKALVGSGASSLLVGGDRTPYTFLSNDTVLIQSAEGTPYTIPFAGGSAASVSGLPVEAINVRMSPSGTTLSWALLKTFAAPYTSDLQVAPLTLTGGTASVGGPTTLDTSAYSKQSSFSRDGTMIHYVKTNGAVGAAGDVHTIPVDGSGSGSPTMMTATPTDEKDVDATAVPGADSTSPGAATALPALLNGTAATVKWTLPADADLSGVLITRKLGTTTQKANVFVPAPVSSYVDSGLTLGATYTYEIKTVDRSGNQGAVATRQLSAIKPVPTYADPTSTTSTKRSFPVTFAAAAPTSATYTVDYLVVGTTTWKRWVANTPGRIRAFGTSSTTAGVSSTTSTPGTNYVFRVQVKDAYGNASAFVSGARAVVPFDQSKATLYGGTTVTSSSSYLGSYRQLRTTASYAKVTLTGNRLQVIGLKCASCGKFAIYAGSTKIATIDTYASSTKARQVLFTKTYTSVASRTFTIRPLATAGRPNVLLDGWATRR